MSYFRSHNALSRTGSLLFVFCCSLFSVVHAQMRWDGEAGDGQWSTASNWQGDKLPEAMDQVLLDNSLVSSSFTVTLPPGSAAVTVASIVITPGGSNTIQLVLQASNTATPALSTSGDVYGLILNKGAVFMNASGSTGAASLLIHDSLRINNGGQYIHHTRSSHAVMLRLLSRSPGTERGVFVFDVPGGGYTIATTGRTYGTLILDASASGSTAASPFTVNGDLVIKQGVKLQLDITAATTIRGQYIQEGGVFNLASQANSNTVFVQGNCLQTAGSIVASANARPSLVFNGQQLQQVQLTGITNQINIGIDNSTGIQLMAPLTIPYKLQLQNGTVHAGGFLVTLLPGAILVADSLPNNKFIDGALRKEGLPAETYTMFPIGSGQTKRWLSLHNASGNYTALFTNANPASLATAPPSQLHHTSALEYWTLKADAQGAGGANVELSFNNVNSGGITDMATLRVAQLQSGSWTTIGNTATSGSAGAAGSVISEAVATIAGEQFFTLASATTQNPLPINLLSFTAAAHEPEILLKWSMAASSQPAAIELQWANEQQTYTTLARFHPAPGQVNYSYTDKNVLTGKRYYRLKTITADGAVDYSEVLVVLSKAAPMPLQLYNAVGSSRPMLRLGATETGQASIEVYDMMGRLVCRQTTMLQRGSNLIAIQLPPAFSGMYAVRLLRPGFATLITTGMSISK